MKYILVLLAAIAASPVLAQNTTTAKTTTVESGNWSKLGASIEGARGFTLHGRDIRLNSEGQYQMQVKITPGNVSSFAKRYSLPTSTNYVLQYATIDCGKRVLLLERTTVYDSSGKTLEARGESLTPSSRKDTVKPGSIGEALYRFVCVETTSLPLTENRH